jgi:hypothetical protein
MPLPGYLGFLLFAVGTIAFFNLLQGIKVFKSYLLRATTVALVFSILSFAMIDRFTVFSYITRLDRLAFIQKKASDTMKGAGVQSSFGIDPALLDAGERDALNLMHLKGLGYDHYVRLKGHGIDSIPALARSDETSLSRILDESNLRRVRVYLKAARQVIQTGDQAMDNGVQ